MTSPYLIQALYGSKPPMTADEDAKPVVHNESTGNETLSETTHKQSLAEMLYGNSTAQSHSRPDLTHPERQQLINSEGTLEDEQTLHEEPELCMPKGSNALPLGTKPDFSFTITKTAPRDSVVLSTKPSSQQISSNTSIANVNSVSNTLKYPPERYLPPPGPYYDQLRLTDVFGMGFFHNKCVICWGPPHTFGTESKCGGVCAICGTTDHPNESCPLLYCTQDWYAARHFPSGFATLYTGQFRPMRTELSTLRKLGIIEASSGSHSPIVPDTHHPLVQEFYHNKASPNMLLFKLTMSNAMPKPDLKNNLSGNVVNSSLDPRLQSLNVTAARFSIEPNVATNATPCHAMVDILASKRFGEAEAEKRIQELEDEVIMLKTENIAKDREIRKLKAENEQLRGSDPETRGKRPRM